MRPAKTKIKKFRMDTKYVHHRSEGLTRRQNGGTRQLLIDDQKQRRKPTDRRAARRKDGDAADNVDEDGSG